MDKPTHNMCVMLSHAWTCHWVPSLCAEWLGTQDPIALAYTNLHVHQK